MILICRNCGSENTDPGGDPKKYYCGVCGSYSLERVATKGEKAFAAAVAGAAFGGVVGGPVGALIGGILALVAGDRYLK